MLIENIVKTKNITNKTKYLKPNGSEKSSKS